MAENPDVKITEISKMLAVKWKVIGDEEKKPFNEKAAADKQRYEEEKAAYNSSN